MANSKRGFTLIEILVSLAIVSIVVAALYSTFFLAHKATEIVDSSLIKLQEARTLIDAMRRELESAAFDRDKPYTLFELKSRNFFEKETAAITFTCFSYLMPSVTKITYAAEEKGGRLALKKEVSSAYKAADKDNGFDLMEDIDSFVIEAKYRDRWVKIWDSSLAKETPEEIKITLTFNAGKQLFTISETVRAGVQRRL
jgi:prepilin-type N-terminal cleavage/methylation domain-containing protein